MAVLRETEIKNEKSCIDCEYIDLVTICKKPGMRCRFANIDMLNYSQMKKAKECENYIKRENLFGVEHLRRT